MRTAYAALLRLYPGTWRQVFGREMTAVFEEAQADSRARGFRDYCLFLLAELSGLLRGAFFTWGEEYMRRARRKLVFSYFASILGGAAVTAFFQAGFYGQLAQMRNDRPAYPHVAEPAADFYLPMVIAGGILLLIGVLSIAFVWNMRIVGNRAGRLKPIWMPAGENARIARRELHRRPERFRKVYNLEDDPPQ